MIQVIAVFIGGGLGSLCRFGVSKLFQSLDPGQLPFATLTSNILSTAILGLIVYRSSVNVQSFWHTMLLVGFCGGFSTFSTFSFETVQLVKSGQMLWAVLNILISISLCAFVLFALSKQIK